MILSNGIPTPAMQCLNAAPKQSSSKNPFHTSSLLSRLIIPHRPHMPPHAAIGSAAPGASSFSLGRSDCPLVSPALSYPRPTLLSIPLPRSPLLPSLPPPIPRILYAYLIKNHPNHKTTARTPRNILAVAHVVDADLEAIAAGARVVVDLQRLVVEAVFDFDFVVQVEVFVGHGEGMWWGSYWWLSRRREGVSCVWEVRGCLGRKV